MEPVACPGFTGFLDEARGAASDDALEALRRSRMCRSGVSTLYVAHDPEGAPMYAQWLVRARDQNQLHAISGLFPRLTDGVVLVEGAYTFERFRRLGAMAAGMHQLLEIARGEGAHTALTFVATDYVPSIRGCARVGFGLGDVRVTRRRLGIAQCAYRPPTEPERSAWARAADGAVPAEEAR
jgi:hypothetical protein